MGLLWSQACYWEAWQFAAVAHQGQLLPGSELPYIVHLGAVAMETIASLSVESVEYPDLAVQCALLHDVLEDTAVTYAQLVDKFGEQVAAGVLALTKDEGIEGKSAQMVDSLRRIQQQPLAVWRVKLADRISNLEKPPFYWSRDKIRAYHVEAGLIYGELRAASPYLAQRLLDRMAVYERYFTAV